MIAIINCGSNKVPYIEQIVDEEMDFKTFEPEDFTADLLNDFSGVIISGAPKLITAIDMTPILQTFEWIKTSKIPVLGICFGHQVMGLLHGANGSLMREDRDWQEVEFMKKNALSNKLPMVLKMMEDHCEAISIPSDFELLASSDVCINEAMKHKTKPLFGVQFHPEVSGNHGAILIKDFVDLCINEKHN